MKTPEAPVLDRLLDAVARIFTPETARRLVDLRADSKAQARVAKLARKCNEGQLSEQERAEYEAYVWTGNFIAIFQAKARMLLAKSSDQS